MQSFVLRKKRTVQGFWVNILKNVRDKANSAYLKRHPPNYFFQQCRCLESRQMHPHAPSLLHSSSINSSSPSATPPILTTPVLQSSLSTHFSSKFESDATSSDPSQRPKKTVRPRGGGDGKDWTKENKIGDNRSMCDVFGKRPPAFKRCERK